MEDKYNVSYRTFGDDAIKNVKVTLLTYIVEKFQDKTYSREHYNYIKWQVMKYTSIPTNSLIIEFITL